ncbi:hypothetical protein SAMN05444412_102375 [Rhodonellum ikkaensis]|uniref:Adhesin domain-containing protein n=2 Tax=Cytophagaceae TaxID=89373 RepID=A0A1H3M713_9BACT|nr:hypothetical protein SAMN05444412_102375 [Rhodonellum ikkaensis]
MLRINCLLICFLLGIVFQLKAQITKEFKVDHTRGYGLVHLDFNVYKGVTHIKKGMGASPVHIFSKLSKVNILPSFSQEIVSEVLYTQLVHRNVESENLGKSLSYKLFSTTNEDFDHKWDIEMNSNFLYDLHLNFGIGKAYLDLSNLPVSNCIIKTASADVKLDYSKKIANSVKMDTLMVTINMGSLDAKNINFSNAKEMFFEINYGTVDLFFSEPVSERINIHTIVGAGKVSLELPAYDQPFIIKVKSTPMCRTNIPKHLKDIGNKTYVSKNYKENAENLMTFTIDVSVGSVTIK